MIKNYLKIAFRNLVNKKVFSVINILGLSFGLACAILIGLWISDEISIDQFHTKEVYHLIVNIKTDEDPSIWTNTPALVTSVLNEKIAGVEHAIKVTHKENAIFHFEDKKYTEVGIFADSAFFEVFDYPLILGDRKTALYGMNVVAISDKLANRIFGTTDVIGKSVDILDQKREGYEITAVYEIPAASSNKFDFVIPYHKYRIGREYLSNPGNFNDVTYVTLLPGVDKKQVEISFSDAIYTQFKDQRDVRNSFYLYPYKDLYLKSDFAKWPVVSGRVEYVKLFTIIGLVILVIACINFMNLSTAQASKRAKEVGVRKTVGARKNALVFQFLGESLLITFIALVLALTIADLLMPVFNNLVGKEMSIPFADPQFLLAIICILIFTGLVSGSYPAIYLSSFQAASVLKGAVTKGKSMGGIRKFLVIFQFTLSIGLIICTIIIYSQINYIRTKDIGVDREQIMTHWMGNIGNQRESYRYELLALPGIESVNMANFNPMMIYNSTNSVDWSGKTEDHDFYFHVMISDNNFIKTFNSNLIAGANLPDHVAKEDTMSYFLLNETAVNMMGLNDPVGAQISVWGNPGKVVGVVQDFNHDNLYLPIDPVVIYYSNSGARCFIKLSEGNTAETIAAIQDIYEKYEDDFAFSYGFLDDEFNATYKHVSTVGLLATIFAGIAIFVSCLGLFGLAGYMAEQRRKETGIRKVMGASIFSLTALFSKDFIKLVAISFIIASPIAYYIMDGWLKEFHFHITPSWWIFLIAGGLALFIALLTVSFHTIKTSIANPVTSLRYE